MADIPLRVLLVDDNPQDRALVSRELEKEYIEPTIVEVFDQQQLDLALADGEFDLVVTDFQLLWSTGLNVLQAIKSRWPMCPVIMFTATGNEEIAVEAMKSGLDDYIIKNVRHLVRLRASVRAALEHARTASDLRAREAELAHVTRLSTLGEMIASIAHEVNQPLHAIANYTAGSLIRLNRGAEDLNQFRETLEQISQLASLAAEILRKYRAYASEHLSDRRTSDLGELLHAATQLLACDIEDHRVSVQCDLAIPGPPITVDRTGICQVLVNLLRNACEAMKETSYDRRQIRVSSRATDTLVEVSISDRGHGLPEEGHEGLLQPFVTTKPKGIGMGLAVSSRIVKIHGGELWATPNDGPGATFHFTLPRAEPQEALI